MKPYFLIFCLLVVSYLFANQVRAQEQITDAEYKRAVSLLWQNVNNKKAFN